MKIAQVNDISNVSSNLIAGLSLLGHETELFKLDLIGGKLPSWCKILVLLWRLREVHAINGYIKTGAFDVVHVHFAYLGWMGILGRYPYFLHCHGTDVRRNLHRFYQRPFIVHSLRVAQMVFYSTPDLAEHVLPVRPDAVWFPNPINIEAFTPDSDGKRLRQRPRVFFISELSQIKGVDREFEVIASLQRQVPEIEIAVMGCGTQFERYRHWPGITVLPRVPYNDMPARIRGFDVVVGQLKLGILSMSEMEAMACGVPVVGEFRYPEFYTEQPPIATGSTTEELVGAIIELLADEEMRLSLGKRSRGWVMRHHDYRQLASVLGSYYLGARSQHNPSPDVYQSDSELIRF